MLMDRLQKGIIRVLIRNRKRDLSTRQIANMIGASPITVKKKLKQLGRKGYVKSDNVGKIRKVKIGKKKIIRVPSKTNWRLRYK